MMLKRFVVGPLETNCYLIACNETRSALLIDAGFMEEDEGLRIVEEIENSRIDLKYVLSTHWHPDHTAGNEYLRKNFGASVIIHEDDASMLSIEGFFLGFKMKPHKPDIILKDSDSIKVGNVLLKVIHTPGHSEGSICLLGEGFVLTGDTLFAGSIGRTDLPGGSFEKIMDSIRSKLMVLPENTIIYPGHGPFSSVGREKRKNPFLNST
jgi:glyoxylase-like metal-dependent hydrolase (beta-lactamase superfamily II)